tara:strand:+ start:121 stop:396 length:276 start_codon:yes stop_codon:yes gene_type:complete
MKKILELSIREYCKTKQLSEGLIDKVVGHVFNILHKSNDKRSAAALKNIANSGPEGKKAVEFALNQQKLAQAASDYGQERHLADLRKKFRR